MAAEAAVPDDVEGSAADSVEILDAGHDPLGERIALVLK